MHRTPRAGRREWKATPFLWAKMFYLQMPETAPKKQLTNKSSYPCVKVAEPSYSGYIVWKVFTTPTTLLNHLTVILPFLMGLLTAALILQESSRVWLMYTQPQWDTELHTPGFSLERIPQTHLRRARPPLHPTDLLMEPWGCTFPSVSSASLPSLRLLPPSPLPSEHPYLPMQLKD